jgi:hypothetical protein
MTIRQNRTHSFGFLITGGLTMWFLAGFFTAVFGLDTPSKLFELPLPLWFPAKAGGVWAAAGFFFVGALPTWFKMSFERSFLMRKAGEFSSEPRKVALLSTATRAVFLGAGIGFVLARWAIPYIGPPEGLALGDRCSTLGAVFTALAYLICVPVAADFALRH